MKKFLLMLCVAVPATLLASDAHADVQTDILERTVNFLIFIAILYYLLADKLKGFFSNRTQSIQTELDKVQEMLKASQKKVEDAKVEVENAKKVAEELVTSASNDVASIKKKIESSVENEIAFLNKTLDEKMSLEVKKVKREVVEEVLNQLLSNENIAISQNDLANIVLKKVA
jgi:F-type H+-transporting ATPase subunit b